MADLKPPRIQKFLAVWGIGSRRMIESWMRQGRILLNGKQAKLGAILRENDEVVVLGSRGNRLYRATLRGVYDVENQRWLKPGFEYWIVNKPRGVLTSTRDPHHKRMVTHLVPSSNRLFPVGRLDKDSEGLLLLTSDGKLCHKLTHPRFGVKKRYHVTLDWPPQEATIDAIQKGGVALEDGETLPAEVKKIGSRRLQIVMQEGRKREIRRLFAYFGHRVVTLTRVSFGPLVLGNMPPGSARQLTEKELKLLKQAVEGPHNRVEKRVHARDKRRPGSARPGHRIGRLSRRSSARRSNRRGSRSK
ncbi:pseudouridine synthase [candidate division WOR-3 bacterium]|uniref:Pseudouridine synthase n=1 Tax=candidate division WOR-3 bacterium TaxID=2052148 RepID=A0A9D5KA67_UNCW3|nr:pseudouridine synthase [candidate division WOR-3 bacterium]MBD3365102.1 pseudouridine synthase [candidate division WOR-3 bacterium]